MFKVIFTLAVFFLVALTLLGLRQQRLAYTSQTAALNGRVWRKRHMLWGQEAQIAARTNPVVLARKLAGDDLPAHDPAAVSDTGAANLKGPDGKPLPVGKPSMPDF